MIFVSLGTQDKSFDRLLLMVQEEINKGNIKDKVIVQAGYTKFKSSDMDIFDYISNDAFEKYIADCDYMITHGGVGNILTGMRLDKKIIAVPRLAEYGEHNNNHQLQIIDEFSKKGYILRGDDLEKTLKLLKKFKPKKWNFDNSNILKKIEEYIDNI